MPEPAVQNALLEQGEQAVKWKYCHPDLRVELPDAPGVYAWFGDGRPLYVGAAHNLRKRAGRYRCEKDGDGLFVTPWGWYSDVALKYRPCKNGGQAFGMESLFIERLRPIGNAMFKTSPGCQKRAISEAKLTCILCKESWIPRRRTVPSQCPRCRKTKWQKEEKK